MEEEPGLPALTATLWKAILASNLQCTEARGARHSEQCSVQCSVVVQWFTAVQSAVQIALQCSDGEVEGDILTQEETQLTSVRHLLSGQSYRYKRVQTNQ